jgi:hypothetical protein|tara:strand:- start:3373 stop:3858 length:486 start_codon:yes stop_codon:yes gene_type:complete
MAKERTYVNGTIGDQSIEALIARHKTKLSSEPRGKRSKYTKRRAIDCKLIRKSKSNPGYCKYMITIAEMDGTIHKQPAYGKDMQSALSRLIKKELTVKVEKKLETNTGIVFLAWLVMVGTPAIFADQQSPWFLAYTFGSIVLLMVISGWWYTHINKGEDNV